jgi:hypothetical protein
MKVHRSIEQLANFVALVNKVASASKVPVTDIWNSNSALDSRYMALGSTQPLTKMSTRVLPGGKERMAHKANNITFICQPIIHKM